MAADALKSAQEGLMAGEKDMSTGNEAADKLASEGTVCIYSISKKVVDALSKDVVGSE